MNTIDWNTIKTAHGTAGNIPVALEKLSSIDSQTRKEGYWQIDNHAVLQGDLYEAAYYVIDPLVQLLTQKNSPDKINSIELLIEITLGWAPTDVMIEIEGKSIPLQSACHSKIKGYTNLLKQISSSSQEKEKNKIDELIHIIDEELG